MQRIKVSGLPVQQNAVTTSDASESLSDLGITLTTASAKETLDPKYVFISVEDNPVRVSLGATATTSKGHLFQVGDSFRIEEQEIPLAEFISATSGNHATLQVTLEY